MYEQLLLFEEPSEQVMKREIESLKTKIDSVRKGQYSRIGSLQKQVDELNRELEFLKAKICKEGMFL